jgi:hypothetical protein
VTESRDVLAAVWPGCDATLIDRVVDEIETVDVCSLEDGWHLYLGDAIRRAWPGLNTGQRVIAYLVARDQESHARG